MPTYNVRLNINVPSVGDKDLIQTGIVAPDIISAIEKAKANIVVDVLAIQRTAP